MRKHKYPQHRPIDSILPPPAKNNTHPFGRPTFIVASTLVAIGLVIAISLSYLHHQAGKDLDNVAVVLCLVARHYKLPSNEKPALATVTDKTKLQSSFSGFVENGDKILIYQTNKKAIVYRPSIDRIVDIEPVSIDTPPSAIKK